MKEIKQIPLDNKAQEQAISKRKKHPKNAEKKVTKIEKNAKGKKVDPVAYTID